MSYCLDDGSELLFGPASGSRSEPPAPLLPEEGGPKAGVVGAAGGQFGDEPKTAILSVPPSPTGGLTQPKDETESKTAILQPPATAGGSDSSEQQSVAANRAIKPLIAAAAAVAVLVGGFFGYRYFSTTRQIESIAVMPFVNESGNADIEYLSDGMTETLIRSLSQLPNLLVKPRSSVFRYKGKDTDAKTIGTELNVQAILNGRVVQRGEQLILSLELIDVQKDVVIWGEQYDRKQSDLVSLQSEIAKDVSTKLKSKLSGAEVAKVEKSYTANPEAYQLYLRGRFQWNRRRTESLKQAADYFKQAIEKDPNYALAYAGLAETYALFMQYDVTTAKDSMPQAKAAALRALELDNSLAAPHAALEMYYTYFEYDRVAAEKEIRRAIELDPNYATAHQWLGTDVLIPTRRFDEAIASSKRAEELDPLSPIIGANLGDAFLYARRYDEAIAQYNRVLSFDSNFAYAHYGLGWAHWQKDLKQEAIAEMRKFVEPTGFSFGKGALGFMLAKSGQRDEAMKIFGELKLTSSRQFVPSYTIAIIHLGLGEKEEALNWLEKEIDEHGPQTGYYAVNLELDELRSEPRFKAMLKRLNLPE